MFNWVRTPVLRILRVPHDPDPPAGAPGSVRVFRAGRNFYKLRLLGWSLGQVGALAGIVFSLLLLARFQHDVDAVRAAPRPPIAQTQPTETSKAKSPRVPQPRTPSALQQMAERRPSWLFPLLTFFEFVGIGLYVVQIPLTYALVRLDYELRWYMVTDRSLRIRSGLASVQETTMSFANVQQVVVTQGPLQRLLGIADVRVQSAGGGEPEHGAGAADSLHTGVFYGVDNASQIRDLILERLRQFRAAGLGDPDDAQAEALAVTAPAVPVNANSDVLAAASAVLEEARALRRIISGGG